MGFRFFSGGAAGVERWVAGIGSAVGLRLPKWGLELGPEQCSMFFWFVGFR